MPDLMQMLFDHIIDHTHEIYCLQTTRAMYQSNRDMLGRNAEAQCWVRPLFGRLVPVPLNQISRLAFQHVANRVQALQRDGSIAIAELTNSGGCQ